MPSQYRQATVRDGQPVDHRRLAPCPAHGHRHKEGPSPFTGRDPRGSDSRFHLVAVLPEAGEAPDVEAQAGARDRVQIGGLFHQVQPTVRTIRKGFGVTAEAFGVVAVEECGQVDLWALGPPVRRRTAQPTRASAAVSS